VGRSKFAGGDQGYLRDVQYRDPSRLTARANLHARYSTAAEPWFPWLAGQIPWPADADVLEVGCGAGWLWEEAAAVLPGLRLTLTDLAPAMVETAAARVEALEQFTVADAREADAQNLPFAAASFDVVLANHMLFHLPEPATGVAELARTCRPDGVVVAATNGARHVRELGAIRHAVFGAPVVDPTVAVFGVESGEPLLRHHFEQVEWRPYPDELACTDPEDVFAFLASAPPVEDATEDQLRAVRDLVDQHFEDGDGVFRISKDAGVFVARDPKH
jgi:2-polyprenyl-3-methyl-5-hydroxy-6-metoxy-1,4-benzoquinol methylase